MKNLIFIFLFALICGCKVNQKLDSPPAQATIFPEKAPLTATRPKPKKTWESELKSSFRAHYKTMVQKQQAKIMQNYPVIIQDFLNMTLIRSNGERIRFKMKKKAYITLAHTTHPPTTVYLLLSAANFNIDNDSSIQKLMIYDTIVQKAIVGIKTVQHLDKVQKDRTVEMLESTQTYLQKIIKVRQTSEAAFQNFAESVRLHTNQNLKDAATEQLTQFKEQLNLWKKTFPEENWSELRVGVLGLHQPRIAYTPTQFFQWLLKEPEFEKRVVYLEFQFSMFGPNRPKAEAYALELLTKVDLDKTVAHIVLGDEILLQQDVMAPMAIEIISGWGDSDWFKEKH